MNIFNGLTNCGPIIDVTELPTDHINKHAIYRLINPNCSIDDPPCGYYKTTHPNWHMTKEGAFNELSGSIIKTAAEIISMIEAGTYTSDYFADADLNVDQAKGFTVLVDSEGNYFLEPGTKLETEFMNLESAVVVDHYIYDIDQWVSIGNAISYVEVLPETTDPIASTKIFILNTSSGGGVYKVEGVYILDKFNNKWIDLLKGRVVMMDKEDYDLITPEEDILYVVV